MNVRAKFKCTGIQQSESSFYDPATGKYNPCVVETATFWAVNSGSEENKKFFASTPNGSISIGVVHKGMFQLGREYYLDFTPAPIPAD